MVHLPVGWQSLGQLHVRSGEPASAAEPFERAVALGREDEYLFYELGLVEARIGRNYWVTSAPFLLETSIRLAPRETFARQAYALLEQELTLSYEGSDQEDVPADEQHRLDELRALLDLD